MEGLTLVSRVTLMKVHKVLVLVTPLDSLSIEHALTASEVASKNFASNRFETKNYAALQNLIIADVTSLTTLRLN